MIPFILSIFSSIIIFVIFKLFKKFKIDTFQAIVFNYFMAGIIGISLYGNTWNNAALEQNGWMVFSLLTSFLFIFLFFTMGRSSQENGVASTSIAVKMSMAFSLVILIVYHSEVPSVLKITGIVLAFLGVLLVSLPEKKATEKSRYIWMLIVLFFGSGALDFMLNYVQENKLEILSPSLFTSFTMLVAGVIGTAILVFRIVKGKSKLAGKNIIAGLILGIPNFFSIYFLLLSYTTTGWTDSTVLALTNVSVVLLSAMFGIILFRERMTKIKIIGLIAALLAITTLYIAQ